MVQSGYGDLMGVRGVNCMSASDAIPLVTLTTTDLETNPTADTVRLYLPAGRYSTYSPFILVTVLAFTGPVTVIFAEGMGTKYPSGLVV